MSKLLLCSLLAAMISVAGASQTQIDLPQLGQPADVALSPAQENQIGNEIVHEFYLGDYIIDDPEITEYLTHLGWRLAAAGTQTPPHFRFFVIADPRINAFAVPGAVIGMNGGTMITAANESELAAVLAHEEAHVTQRHIARENNDTEAGTIATWAAVLAAIIAGSGNPNVIIGALALGQGINNQRQVSYTRGNEMEADRFGIRTLANAGFDPTAMASFFERLEQQSRLYGTQLPEILQTHPVNTTRITEATERAAAYPKRHVVDSIDFAFVQARTRVYMTEMPNQGLEYFRQRISGPDAEPADRYGYALSLSEVGRDADALQALAPVLAEYPRLTYLNLLRADCLVSTGHVKEAMSVYAKLLEMYPQSPPVILEYAQALLDSGNPDLARQILIDGDSVLSNHVDRFKLLSQAASAVGNTSEAQYQMGNYLAERGDFRGAVEQIDAGLRLSSMAPDDRARLLARRREIIAVARATRS